MQIRVSAAYRRRCCMLRQVRRSQLSRRIVCVEVSVGGLQEPSAGQAAAHQLATMAAELQTMVFKFKTTKT